MRSRFPWLVSTFLVVLGTLVACAPPDVRKRSSICEEGEDDCASPNQTSRNTPSGSEIGLPEPARAEDQEQPPPEALRGSASVDVDAGTPLADGGTAVLPSAKPTLDASNACWSGTLNAWVEKNGCYQRKSDAMWFQCGFDTPSQSNSWFRNVVDGVGRFGTCSSLHPLK